MGEGTVSGAPAAGSGLSTASSGAAGAAAPVTQEKPISQEQKQKVVLDHMTPEQRITFWTLEKAEQDAFVNQGYGLARDGEPLASPGGDNKPLTEEELAKCVLHFDYLGKDSDRNPEEVRAMVQRMAAENGANVMRGALVALNPGSE